MKTRGVASKSSEAKTKADITQKKTLIKLTLDYSQGWNYVNLRVPSTLLKEIDEHLMIQPERMHRMQWIIEAMIEKLNREKQGN